ncbi:hypothetical protein [Clostridium perfringens]|uniref:hypothetical protein n=1 Tax=Clostridium perfringens TaxID=1502 RepID=UPI00189A5436|nr:hypothetical protein [Clostridium perfringens]HBI6962464.1 hypothetical protein [Clostridium perfringens]
MNIKEYKENLVINEKDLAIINIAKCYIKHEDKERALKEIHSLGIKFRDETGKERILITDDIDFVVNEILNTDLVDTYKVKKKRSIKKTLKFIDMLQDLDIHMKQVDEEYKQLKEIREVLKVLVKS